MRFSAKSATVVWAIIFYHLAFLPPYRGFPLNLAFPLGLVLGVYLSWNIKVILDSPYKRSFILSVLVLGIILSQALFHYLSVRSLLLPYTLLRMVLLAFIPFYAFIVFAIKNRLSMAPIIKNIFILMVGVQLLACAAMIAYPPLKEIVFVRLLQYDNLKELNIALSSMRVSGFGQAFLFTTPIVVSFLGAAMVMLGFNERHYLMLFCGVATIIFALFNARTGVILFGLTLMPLLPYFFVKRVGVSLIGGFFAIALCSLGLFLSLSTERGYEMGQWIVRAFVADSNFTESHLISYSRLLFNMTFLPSGLSFLIGDGSSAFRGTSLNIEARTDSGYSIIFYAGGLLYFICGILLYAIQARQAWKASLPCKLFLIGFSLSMLFVIFKGNALYLGSLYLSFMLFCLVQADELFTGNTSYKSQIYKSIYGK